MTSVPPPLHSCRAAVTAGPSRLRQCGAVLAGTALALLLLTACQTRSGDTSTHPAPTRTPTTVTNYAASPSPASTSATRIPVPLPSPAASSGSSPTTATTPSSMASEAFDRLEQGLIAYNPPQEVIQDEEFDVVVRLQRGTSVTSTALPQVPGPGPVTIETLKVGPYLSATLNGAGFDVEPTEAQRAPLAYDDTVEFSWVVAAKSTGAHTLRLSLTAEVTPGATTAERGRQRVYERTINVNVAPAPSLTSRVFSWTGWTDVAAGVIVLAAGAGAAWLVRWRRRRGKDVAESSGASPVTADETTSPSPLRANVPSSGPHAAAHAPRATSPRSRSGMTSDPTSKSPDPGPDGGGGDPADPG